MRFSPSGRRDSTKHTRARRFSNPSINHYKIPIQQENVTEVTLSLKERTPGCNAKGTRPDKSGGLYYFPPPQHRTPDSFCMKLGFSGSCLLGWVTFGLAAGVTRADARFGWLCWNCAWVDAPSGGASSPMLFLFICESRFMSLGLRPG